MSDDNLVMVTERDSKRDTMFAFVLGSSLVLNMALSVICLDRGQYSQKGMIHAVHQFSKDASGLSSCTGSCPFTEAFLRGRERLRSAIRSPYDRFQGWIQDEVTRQIQSTLGEQTGQVTDALLRPDTDVIAEPVITPWTPTGGQDE